MSGIYLFTNDDIDIIRISERLVDAVLLREQHSPYNPYFYKEIDTNLSIRVEQKNAWNNGIITIWSSRWILYTNHRLLRTQASIDETLCLEANLNHMMFYHYRGKYIITRASLVGDRTNIEEDLVSLLLRYT